MSEQKQFIKGRFKETIGEIIGKNPLSSNKEHHGFNVSISGISGGLFFLGDVTVERHGRLVITQCAGQCSSKHETASDRSCSRCDQP